jgi:hypothetical protein
VLALRSTQMWPLEPVRAADPAPTRAVWAAQVPLPRAGESFRFVTDCGSRETLLRRRAQRFSKNTLWA